MADALCGPSNALQNFQKHAAVDRSLQQDRLAVRPGAGQSFRSAPSPGASHVDADFHSFQAGQPLLRESSPFARQATPPRLMQPAMPDWAADFQKMRLNNVQPIAPAPVAASMPMGGSAWQDEFLRQQASTVRSTDARQTAPAMWQPQQPAFSPFTGANMYTQPMQPQRHENAVQEPQFDDAAFARAFEDIESQVEESQSKGKERAVEREPVVKFDLGQSEEQHISGERDQAEAKSSEQFHREQAGVLSDRIDLSHASTHMGDVTGEYDYQGAPWVPELQSMRREAGWDALDAFQRAHDLEYQSTGSQESLNISNTIEKMRTDERSSQSQTPEPPAETIRIGADVISATEEHAEPMTPDAEADALAQTAGQLIENLRNEQSTKFQQSSFMELMRQLRDREVRVEGENMVNVKQARHPGGRFYPSDAFIRKDDGVSESHLDGDLSA